MHASDYPQGMTRTARTDDGDVEAQSDACRHHDYTHAPDHGFAFAPPGGIGVGLYVDCAALFATDGETLPTEGR